MWTDLAQLLGMWLGGCLIGYQSGWKRSHRAIECGLRERLASMYEHVAASASEAHSKVQEAESAADLASALRQAHAAVSRLERAAYGAEH
jgi:hypothetical protein